MKVSQLTAALVLIFGQALCSQAFAEDEAVSHEHAIKVVAEQRLAVGNSGTLPLYVSVDWSRAQPAITRAVIVLHGRLRNADVYYRSALAAQAAAGEAGKSTIMIVPQFLAEVDMEGWHLPPDTLRWSLEGWEGGEPALGPSSISSFDVLDAILVQLANKYLFPNLKQVVFAGHSGGGQVVQRYAIAAPDEPAYRAPFSGPGYTVRYVVANPSSYAYFSAERPEPQIATSCPGYNNWKYGMGKRPRYLASPIPAELEQRYVARQVIYLLGTDDTNPNHPRSTRAAWLRPKALIVTCAAIPTRPRWPSGMAARQITGCGTCRASATTATRC